MKKIYIVGIGGAGTSALAVVYAKRGFMVSGSDDGDGFYHEMLRHNNISVFESYDEDHITDDIDLIVHTTAVLTTNVELVAAKRMGISVMTYPEAVGELTREMSTIAVCGTHGKTTTTALTTYGLITADAHPTAIVGSRISSWGSGAYVDGDACLVIEADEYQNKLALYQPHDVILTSVDFDHPDFFADEIAYQKVFVDFIKRVPQDGYIIACGDHRGVREVVQNAQRCHVIFYGEDINNDCVIIDRTTHEHGQMITVRYNGVVHTITTQLYGMHNAKNASAAWLMGFIITGRSDAVAEGIAGFVGTARRFERRGEYHGAILIDDYAHHPAEIEATVQATREVCDGKRIIVAFHPHTFTRTKALLYDFVKALRNADHVIVLDIYGSARESWGDIGAYQVVEAINAVDANKAEHVPAVSDLFTWMQQNLSDKDVFLTLGAGDIWKIYDILETTPVA
jgi:UDP-N-acetylmuramate--alanine ligase